MGTKFDKVVEEMKAELEGAEETKPAVEETEQDDDQKPAGEGPEQDGDSKPAVEETKPADDEQKQDDQKPAQIPDDPVKRAEFSFRRQLAKNKEKHEKELADRDAKYDELLKKFEALEKKVTPPEEVKTRDSFSTDEEYMDYLTDRKVKAMMAERDEAQAKAEQERQAKEAEQRKQEEEVKERQRAWLENVDQAFGEDKERSKAFLQRVQYANQNGLGEILDNCPVAADYLMNDPMGPRVFEKILNDQKVFSTVFDMRRLTPMSIFYELKKVEDGLVDVSTEKTEKTQDAPKVPHLGKPGRQAGASSMGGDMFDDPKAVKEWLRNHR
jgi:hypothetical protein